MLDELATKVTIRIAAPLYKFNGAMLPIDQPEGRYTVQVTIVPREGDPLATGNVIAPGDAHGAFHNTLLAISFPKGKNVSPPPEQPSEAQLLATTVINFLIDQYRIHTTTPQIRRIAPVEAGWHTYLTESGRQGECRRASGMPPWGEAAPVDAGDPDLIRLLTSTSGKHQPLYRVLHMDAIAGWHSLDKRAALVNLYMSFEMLAWTTYEAIATAKFGKEAYARDHAFDPEARTPSLWRVLKDVNGWHPSGYTANVLIKNHVEPFWTHRDPTMHGRNIDPPWREIAAAFATYEDLAIRWLDAALTAAGGPTE